MECAPVQLAVGSMPVVCFEVAAARLASTRKTATPAAEDRGTAR